MEKWSEGEYEQERECDLEMRRIGRNENWSKGDVAVGVKIL